LAVRFGRPGEVAPGVIGQQRTRVAVHWRMRAGFIQATRSGRPGSARVGVSIFPPGEVSPGVAGQQRGARNMQMKNFRFRGLTNAGKCHIFTFVNL
jgi:hypothetical protein